MRKIVFLFIIALCAIFIYTSADAATTHYNPVLIRLSSSVVTCKADSICVDIKNVLLYNNQYSLSRKFPNSDNMRTIREYKNYLEKTLKKNLTCSSIKGKYDLYVGLHPPVGYSILKSSGNSQIDEWAINSIRDIGPYKYMEYYDGHARFKIKLQYYCK